VGTGVGTDLLGGGGAAGVPGLLRDVRGGAVVRGARGVAAGPRGGGHRLRGEI